MLAEREESGTGVTSFTVDPDGANACTVTIATEFDARGGIGGITALLALRRHGIAAELFREPPFEMPATGSEPLSERPVIVGSGPAGGFRALFPGRRGDRR